MIEWKSCTSRNLNREMRKIRNLIKINVYGKRLTSHTLFAIKTKLLTVKCFTYTIYSKERVNVVQRHFV